MESQMAAEGWTLHVDGRTQPVEARHPDPGTSNRHPEEDHSGKPEEKEERGVERIMHTSQ